MSDWNKDYGVAVYEKDLAAKDSIGIDIVMRMVIYDPLCYLTQNSKGQGSSTITPA